MINKHSISIILLIFSLSLACSSDDDEVMMPDILDITWYHSYEEDTDNYEVYRTESFDFPPARFRYGFQLQASGSGWELTPGPADVPLTIAGQWQYIEEDNAFLLSLQSDDTKTFTVVDHQQDILKLIVQ